MPLTSGTHLGIYEIQASIGAGGMGEVYRATDTRLGRDVAVKILPTEMAQDPERLVRFHREARSVAALNHPNVVTVYSVEECDGVHFLTMELIEGQPLDRLISANGLPVERIVEIAGALAEALAAAHEKGVVLHEMATGRRPFEGTSSADLISSILRDTPQLVTDVRYDLPDDLARVIRRCLEKDPRH